MLRAVDRFREGTNDVVHFEEAVQLRRVLVSNDSDMKALAEKWLDEGRPFPGLVWWPRKHYARMSISEILWAFENLASQEAPFGAYPIVHVTPRR